MSNAVLLDTPALCLIAAAAAVLLGILEVAVTVWAARRLQRSKGRDR